MDFRVFHLTNPAALESGSGEQPILMEYGPYSFKETRIKEDITEVAGDRLRYGLYMGFEYDPEHTKALGCVGPNGECTEDDEVLALNMAMTLLPVVSLYYVCSQIKSKDRDVRERMSK